MATKKFRSPPNAKPPASLSPSLKAPPLLPHPDSHVDARRSQMGKRGGGRSRAPGPVPVPLIVPPRPCSGAGAPSTAGRPSRDPGAIVHHHPPNAGAGARMGGAGGGPAAASSPGGFDSGPRRPSPPHTPHPLPRAANVSGADGRRSRAPPTDGAPPLSSHCSLGSGEQGRASRQRPPTPFSPRPAARSWPRAPWAPARLRPGARATRGPTRGPAPWPGPPGAHGPTERLRHYRFGGIFFPRGPLAEASQFAHWGNDPVGPPVPTQTEIGLPCHGPKRSTISRSRPAYGIRPKCTATPSQVDFIPAQVLVSPRRPLRCPDWPRWACEQSVRARASTVCALHCFLLALAALPNLGFAHFNNAALPA